MKLRFRRPRWGSGIAKDLRSRVPYYLSDFKDAYNYRVIPSAIYIFFTNLLPAIAFAQDMFDRTDNSYGVNEVLMSSAIAGVIFGLFSGQPLCIVGVTGPIAIFSYTVYDLMEGKTKFFPFMCWIYLWAMVMHIVIALLNWVSFMKIISLFSCDVFGFFICIVYCEKAVAILSNQFTEKGAASGFCSVMISLLMVLFGLGSSIFGAELHYFKPTVRKVFIDYGVPAAVIFFTGFVHFGGWLDNANLARLPITKSYAPTKNDDSVGRSHGWFIHFWPNENLSVGDMFLAIPFALLLTFLFYFDHNVSSMMCQAREFPLKKPAAFHWDFLLLGLVTGLAGILGIPAPNGLIPQAPLHTSSLVVHDNHTGTPVSVVEQRVTNTIQGAFTFVMMTRPFLVILGLIPQAILAGLFFIMGMNGLHGNIIVNRIRFVFMDSKYIENDPTCPQIFKEMHAIPKDRRKWFLLYLALQIIAGVAEFVITMTKGAIAFPGVLVFFALCAKWIWPLIIPKEDLEYLDGAVVEDFISKSLDIEPHEKLDYSLEPSCT